MNTSVLPFPSARLKSAGGVGSIGVSVLRARVVAAVGDHAEHDDLQRKCSATDGRLQRENGLSEGQHQLVRPGIESSSTSYSVRVLAASPRRSRLVRS